MQQAMERTTSWNSTKGACVCRQFPRAGKEACAPRSAFMRRGRQDTLLLLPFRRRAYPDTPAHPSQSTHTRTRTHTNADDDFGMEWDGDLLRVDLDHSLMVSDTDGHRCGAGIRAADT